MHGTWDGNDMGCYSDGWGNPMVGGTGTFNPACAYMLIKGNTGRMNPQCGLDPWLNFKADHETE